MMQIEHVNAGYRGVPVLHDVSLALPKGSLTVLIGPNGSGKSTLLKTAAGLIRPMAGSVRLKGKNMEQYPQKTLAKTLALLPQQREIPELTVRELVSHGRYPYLSFLRMLSQTDRRAVEEALHAVRIQHLAEKKLCELSGGERQRAYVAMLLAQEAELLLLDEPAAHLDIGCQLELISLIGELRSRGKTLMVVMHDLTRALSMDARLCLMEAGHITALGDAGELLSSGAVERAFGVQAVLLRDDRGNIQWGFEQKK